MAFAGRNQAFYVICWTKITNTLYQIMEMLSYASGIFCDDLHHLRNREFLNLKSRSSY